MTCKQLVLVQPQTHSIWEIYIINSNKCSLTIQSYFSIEHNPVKPSNDIGDLSIKFIINMCILNCSYSMCMYMLEWINLSIQNGYKCSDCIIHLQNTVCSWMIRVYSYRLTNLAHKYILPSLRFHAEVQSTTNFSRLYDVEIAKWTVLLYRNPNYAFSM